MSVQTYPTTVAGSTIAVSTSSSSSSTVSSSGDRKRRGDEADYHSKRSKHHHSSSSSHHHHHHSSSSHHHHHSSSSSSHRPPPPVDPARAAKQFIPEAGGVGTKKPKSEFLCDIDYTNQLPPIPIEPKLIKVYLPPERLYKYCGSSLELSLPIPFHFDKFVGHPLDLFHPEAYRRPEYRRKDEVDEEDKELLPTQKEHQLTTIGSFTLTGRVDPSQQLLFQQGSSNWLKKKEFQSNNLYDVSIKTLGAAEELKRDVERAEAAKKKALEENTRERQIELIEQTFTYAKEIPVHPLKAHVKPVEILPIFPHLNEQEEEYIHANNVDSQPPKDWDYLGEDEKKQLQSENRRKTRFNVEFCWTEFDYPPMEDNKKENKDKDKDKDKEANANAMQVDTETSTSTTATTATNADATATASPSPSPSASSPASSSSSTSSSTSKLIPLLLGHTPRVDKLKKWQIWDSRETEQGLYVFDPNQPDGPKDEENATDADEEADAEQTKADKDNVIGKEYYRWQKEYKQLPAPLVEPENNYFFIRCRQADGSFANEIRYAQYKHRIKIAKRTQGKRDMELSRDTTSRPSAVRVKYVKQYEEEEEEEEEEGEAEGEEEVEADAEEDEQADGAVDVEEDEEGERMKMKKKKKDKSKKRSADEDEEGEESETGVEAGDGDATMADADQQTSPKQAQQTDDANSMDETTTTPTDAASASASASASSSSDPAAPANESDAKDKESGEEEEEGEEEDGDGDGDGEDEVEEEEEEEEEEEDDEARKARKAARRAEKEERKRRKKEKKREKKEKKEKKKEKKSKKSD